MGLTLLILGLALLSLSQFMQSMRSGERVQVPAGRRHLPPPNLTPRPIGPSTRKERLFGLALVVVCFMTVIMVVNMLHIPELIPAEPKSPLMQEMGCYTDLKSAVTFCGAACIDCKPMLGD